MPNYPAMAEIGISWGPAPEGPSDTWDAGHEQSNRFAFSSGHRSRAWGRPTAGAAEGHPEQGWRPGAGVKAGRRSFSSSRRPAPGPLPLARSRFACPHPHRPLACGRRFPSLGFELPALTNRCLPAPSREPEETGSAQSAPRGREGAPARLALLLTLYTSAPGALLLRSRVRLRRSRLCQSPLRCLRRRRRRWGAARGCLRHPQLTILTYTAALCLGYKGSS